MRYQEYILEGNPGAGKSSVLARIEPALKRAGLNVDLVAPFRVVKEDLKSSRPGEDPLYDIWQSKKHDEALLALHELRKVVEQARNKMSELGGEAGVLLFDRGWLTLFRALEDMGVTSPEIEVEKQFWLNHNKTPDTFFLTTSPDISLAANKSRDLKADWRSASDVLEEDYDRRKALIGAHRDRVISTFEVTDLNQDRGPIARAILDHVLSRVK